MSRGVFFLDSSAVTKLVVAEPEFAALAERLTGQSLVASALLSTEVSRAVHRAVGRSHDALRPGLLDLVVVVDRGILAAPAELEPAIDAPGTPSWPVPWSWADRIDALISDDDRLLGARAAGLAVEGPT